MGTIEKIVKIRYKLSRDNQVPFNKTLKMICEKIGMKYATLNSKLNEFNPITEADKLSINNLYRELFGGNHKRRGEGN